MFSQIYNFFFSFLLKDLEMFTNSKVLYVVIFLICLHMQTITQVECSALLADYYTRLYYAHRILDYLDTYLIVLENQIKNKNNGHLNVYDEMFVLMMLLEKIKYMKNEALEKKPVYWHSRQGR